MQTYTLPQSRQQVEARPGQIIHCDVFCRFLNLTDRLSSGLGMNFRAMPNGTLSRVFF